MGDEVRTLLKPPAFHVYIAVETSNWQKLLTDTVWNLSCHLLKAPQHMLTWNETKDAKHEGYLFDSILSGA